MEAIKDKKVIIGVGIAVLLVLAFVLLRGGQPSKTTQPIQKTSMLSDEDLDIIPTVGPEVKVSLESVQKGKEIKIVIDGVPTSTAAIEYELTYPTDEKEAEGLFGTASPEEGGTEFGKTFERQITVGTCSKAVCRYHKVTGPFQVTIKFEGTYGAQLFQSEFPSANL